MPRPGRARYEGDKRLMKLEDEGVLTCYQCMQLELLADIACKLAKPGTLEEKPKLKPKKK